MCAGVAGSAVPGTDWVIHSSACGKGLLISQIPEVMLSMSLGCAGPITPVTAAGVNPSATGTAPGLCFAFHSFWMVVRLEGTAMNSLKSHTNVVIPPKVVKLLHHLQQFEPVAFLLKTTRTHISTLLSQLVTPRVWAGSIGFMGSEARMG